MFFVFFNCWNYISIEMQSVFKPYFLFVVTICLCMIVVLIALINHLIAKDLQSTTTATWSYPNTT